MIHKEARSQIKGYLEGFIQGIVNEARKTGLKPTELRPTKKHSTEGDIKPFHEALLPDGILRITEFERSFSTKLGSTFEETAKLIAQSKWARAERGFRVEGLVPIKALEEIDEIVAQLKAGAKSYPEMVGRVLSKTTGPTSTRVTTADVFLLAKDGSEAYFEIKSPKPNKGQCLEVTERLLLMHAIRKAGPPKVRTFWAMAYNPYGQKRAEYKHSFTLNYLDFEEQILLGSQFWDFIGGSGTYEEVLEIYREVGREKGPDMLDKLALEY